jgi:hypothetical protein
MVALWVIIIILIQSVVLVFALSLCKSAALADRQFEKARQAEQHKWAASSHAVESGNPIPVSTEAQTVDRVRTPAQIHRR